MKGKLELRFIAPNVSKLRSRVENPSKDLSAQIRSIINESVAEVAESNQYELKAKILKKVAAMEASGAIKFNNPQHRAQVFDITGDIFSTAFTATAEEFEKRFPSDEKPADKKDKKADKKEDAPVEEVAGDAPGDEFSE